MNKRKCTLVSKFLIFTLLCVILSCSNSSNTKSKDELLSGKDLDAVDYVITFNSLSAAFNPISLSSELKERLSKYDSKVYREMNVNGVDEPFISGGAKTIISLGDEFTCSLEGELNYNIKFIEGEVGIIEGNIFVKGGTQVLINEKKYVFYNSNWILMKK